jgi:hypothetical protein
VRAPSPAAVTAGIVFVAANANAAVAKIRTKSTMKNLDERNMNYDLLVMKMMMFSTSKYNPIHFSRHLQKRKNT